MGLAPLVVRFVQIAGPMMCPALREIVVGRPVNQSAGLLGDLSATEVARIRHYHQAITGQKPRPQNGGQDCLSPESPLPRAVLCHEAQDIMQLWGRVAPEEIHARQASVRVRAASRARADLAGTRSVLRHEPVADDIYRHAARQPYAGFFAVEEYDIGWRRFDGQMSATATRAAFVSGDAVTVLPYDPVRDRVLLVEQFRAGPYARGDNVPWQLEAIAGRIDPGETPEQAARREAVEEAGLTLGDLRFVASYYPSPGALSEFIYSYVALADLPDGSAGVFGVADEHEDIRGHLVAFDTLMALISSAEVCNSPLILTAWWLAGQRASLRGT